MSIAHCLLALMVVLIWGVNFLFVKISLNEITSLQLCALRFILASFPAVLFIKPPAGVPFKDIATYGLVVFGLQFGFLFLGMEAGIGAGMASLVLQVQVFFSMFFAMIFLKEQPNPFQILGALVAFSGIGMVALHFNESMTFIGFMLIIAAAASWGIGILIVKKIQTNNLIAVIVWGSFVASFPMLMLSLLLEGPSSFINTLHRLSWRGFGSLLYIVYASTWIGYGVWYWLIARYPIGMVVPFTLLVPVVAIMCSVVFLHEPFESWQLLAGTIVLLGLGIHMLSSRLIKMRQISD